MCNKRHVGIVRVDQLNCLLQSLTRINHCKGSIESCALATSIKRRSSCVHPSSECTNRAVPYIHNSKHSDVP